MSTVGTVNLGIRLTYGNLPDAIQCRCAAARRRLLIRQVIAQLAYLEIGLEDLLKIETGDVI